MKKLLKYILDSIVEKPEDIEITEKEVQENVLEYQISVNPEDMGRVIGKNGKVIKAIREILYIKASQAGKKVYLNLEE